ncbi:peptidoglycan-binding domain-containing protein [Austwickia chelonae]|uniref:Peptidoglycan binding-like domain-containing protein n=1 Tax=Austwickia chelonae NBRC 105200 TaxID=1184607 RepID=K6WBI9_9MICO|nr:peptidoglycan-binding domain-containing protein [Austwickia chelonae]GAB79197.1 hypothetical protein AUCHE_21_00220 [Austwickia chelonae NBRC 105200]
MMVKKASMALATALMAAGSFVAIAPAAQAGPWPNSRCNYTVETPVLSRGSTGAAVRQLQCMLNQLGYKLDVDGSFGPATHRAVIHFQGRYGLEVDGYFGPASWTKIYQLVP